LNLIVLTSGSVKISVLDIMGRLMEVVYDGYMTAGKHLLPYDAGTMISSGKYLIVLQSKRKLPAIG